MCGQFNILTNIILNENVIVCFTQARKRHTDLDGWRGTLLRVQHQSVVAAAAGEEAVETLKLFFSSRVHVPPSNISNITHMYGGTRHYYDSHEGNLTTASCKLAFPLPMPNDTPSIGLKESYKPISCFPGCNVSMNGPLTWVSYQLEVMWGRPPATPLTSIGTARHSSAVASFGTPSGSVFNGYASFSGNCIFDNVAIFGQLYLAVSPVPALL